jgi:hypothetical protein
MKYSDKVKKASTILKAINGLSEDQSIDIVYKGDTYKVSVYKTYNDEMSYSVWKDYRGMNVSKVGKTSLTLYTFDMMGQKTTYRLSLLDCSLLPE